MAGNFSHAPHPHPYPDHPIDFINPDCHFWGKTLDVNVRRSTILLGSVPHNIFAFGKLEPQMTAIVRGGKLRVGSEKMEKKGLAAVVTGEGPSLKLTSLGAAD